MKIRDIDQLIEVAARIFAEKGFEQTRIEDIATELGLVKGSLYYHVNGKPGLLFLVIARTIQPMIDTIDEIAASSCSAEEKVRTAIVRHMAHLLLPESRLLFDQGIDLLPDDQRSEIIALNDRYRLRMRDILAEGVAAGEFQAQPAPDFAALLLLGMVNWTQRWFRPNGSMSVDEVSESICNLFLEGYAAPRGSSPK